MKRTIVLLVVLCGCERPASKSVVLAEVIIPDLTRVDAPVRSQIRNTHASLTRLIAARAPEHDLGAAFGEYAMLLHAAEYDEAAEPAYLNAQALVADDPRWPYHLAHLYRNRGDTERSILAFQRVLELRPDTVPALIWLGRVYLDQGKAAEAGTLFARAATLMPQAVAARVGLGQVALSRREYRKAVEEFESALATDPAIASVYACRTSFAACVRWINVTSPRRNSCFGAA